VIGTLEDLYTGIAKRANISVEQLHTTQRILCSLKEQHRLGDVGEVGGAQFLWLSGGMERVGVEDQALAGIAFGGEISAHPTAHRPPGQKEGVDIAPESSRRSLMGCNQFLGAIGTLRPSFGVRIVEGHDGVATCSQTLANGDHVWMLLIGPRAMGKQDAAGTRSLPETGYLATLPCDSDLLDHGPNLNEKAPLAITVRIMELVIHENAAAVADAAATLVDDSIATSSSRFSLGLAGGSTPKATYQNLSTRSIDWDGIDVWLADERWVPYDSPDSNGHMAATTLFGSTDASFHRPEWSPTMDPEESAASYGRLLRRIHEGTRPDLVLLGLGSDGHTASLFPDSGALTESHHWYVSNTIPETGEYRLTATFPMLHEVALIVVLVVGVTKAQALRDSLDRSTPAGLLGDGDARVIWLVDEEAASLVSS